MTLINQASTLMEYHWWVVLSLPISLELTQFRSSSLGCVLFVAARSTPKGALDQAESWWWPFECWILNGIFGRLNLKGFMLTFCRFNLLY